MKIQQAQLAQHLQANLAAIYLVSGDEPLLIQESCKLIRDSAHKQGFTERNYYVADKDFNWQQLATIANNLSLFSDKTIIELNMPTGKPGDTGSKALQNYVKDIPADKILLISTCKLDAAAQKSKWFKSIAAVGVFIPIWPIDANRLPNWIAARMQQAGLSTNPAGIKLLTEYVEGNLLAASQTIEKLRLLYGTGKLETQQIATTIADHARFNIFNLADSAMQGNNKKTLRILHSLKNEKTEPILILWALARELRKHNNKRSKLQHCAKIDRIIKGMEPGNIWNELERLCLNQSVS